MRASPDTWCVQGVGRGVCAHTPHTPHSTGQWQPGLSIHRSHSWGPCSHLSMDTAVPFPRSTKTTVSHGSEHPVTSQSTGTEAMEKVDGSCRLLLGQDPRLWAIPAWQVSRELMTGSSRGDFLSVGVWAHSVQLQTGKYTQEYTAPGLTTETSPGKPPEWTNFPKLPRTPFEPYCSTRIHLTAAYC